MGAAKRHYCCRHAEAGGSGEPLQAARHCAGAPNRSSRLTAQPRGPARGHRLLFTSKSTTHHALLFSVLCFHPPLELVTQALWSCYFPVQPSPGPWLIGIRLLNRYLSTLQSLRHHCLCEGQAAEDRGGRTEEGWQYESRHHAAHCGGSRHQSREGSVEDGELPRVPLQFSLAAAKTGAPQSAQPRRQPSATEAQKHTAAPSDKAAHAPAAASASPGMQSPAVKLTVDRLGRC